jgi:phosphatidylglycerophosphate synthase
MRLVLTILVAQGVLGAFDTIWYHEWKQKLPRRPESRKELRFHAARDFVYAILFATLAWVEWRGAWVWILGLLLFVEIVITMLDFVEEDRSRKVPAGERIMHGVMGIVYGSFLALFVPYGLAWSRQPLGFGTASYGALSWVISAMALGVLISGLRDLSATAPTERLQRRRTLLAR